ncbi:MAG: hypothetical protein CVU61_08365 [Deltaproteobacteria bacterium HGW-Deltaproteobacteria-19]|nr:MAG: hypothetical protein CVU61_08365 [Deltaproteobacteria bacterium HGW-Deltaproteobacteria-19]
MLPNPHLLQIMGQKVGYDGDPQMNIVDPSFQPLIQNGKGIYIAFMVGKESIHATGKPRRIVSLQGLQEDLPDRFPLCITNGTFPSLRLIPPPYLG